MPAARLTQAEIELRNQTILEGLQSGKRLTDLATDLRVNVRTVARWVRIMKSEGQAIPDVDISISDKPRNQRNSIESRLESIHQMQQAGYSVKEMASVLGISTRYVSKHMAMLDGRQWKKPVSKTYLEQNRESKNCTLCGLRFNPVLRDFSSSKCEACYQYLLQKMTCKTCGKVFVDQSRGLKDKRAECWTCKPSLNDLSEKLPRMWRDERWFQMFRQHQEGCMVCGSQRALTRDGRFCSWEHDPDFLDDDEAEALLVQYWKQYAIK